MRPRMFGWIAGAIAVAAGALLAVDIAHKQGDQDGAVVHTLAVAKAAGAAVLPPDAKASEAPVLPR